MVTDIYIYLKKFADIIYQDALARQKQLLYEIRGVAIVNVFFLVLLFLLSKASLGSIKLCIVCFLLSLWLCGVAILPRKKCLFPHIDTLRNQIEVEYENFKTLAQREKYYIKTLENIERALYETNKERYQVFTISLLLCMTGMITLCVYIVRYV